MNHVPEVPPRLNARGQPSSWYNSFMKTGVQEAKDFFSGKDFKWFERKEIKNEQSLSPQDTKWLKGWSWAPIGVASIFYIASSRRKLYDIATVLVVTYIFFELHDRIIGPLLIIDGATAIPEKYPYGLWVAVIYYFLIAIPLWIASLYVLYFSLRHSRRLSWNRGDWVSVDELRKSEKKWLYFNTIPSLVFIAVVAAAFYLVVAL